MEYKWVGSDKDYIDEINILQLKNNLVLGRFGGNSSVGQYKNEDGCLIWINEQDDWELATLLDAHDTAQSADLVIKSMDEKKEEIKTILQLPLNKVFPQITSFFLNHFASKEFLAQCKMIQGETACLIVVRKKNYLWWLSIGDCILALNHPEFSKLGEYQQNHRSFYEWIGQNSTFHQDVPTYNLGVKELRKGITHIFLTTDGLIECPNTDYHKIGSIFKGFETFSNQESVYYLLKDIKNKNIRDSTTIISWFVRNTKEATTPSDLGFSRESS
ncbi:protein phosphatase 2C domain-containing protein [Niallia sp. MER TA 168]|uniref:protein phosphatase 2C domain-containing protein n=1 Tax=Niallia sp. MER TA 168 TaxID=2939568 RepID=UPI00203D9060|nr:protein phosphatase 2C domain-containing protein [Niallia sp. MER TA 168]MCM3362170.1 protein phosphatase 2C domain-containing protein [Niallia sp. MER TA 168]